MTEHPAIGDALLDLDIPASGRSLFAEDFDLAPATDMPPEPEVIEPTFSAAELEAARNHARHAGHAAAVAELAAADHAVIRRTVTEIAAQLANAREAAADVATRSAEAIAALLLDSLALALPALCAGYGDAELAAVIGAVLPALTQEPAITVRLHPRHEAMVTREVERLDPDLAGRTRIVPLATMAPGDVRVVWRNGSATRDTAALWARVSEALGVVGLLQPQTALAKETELAG